MSFVAIYARVLALLKPEKRLSIILALANIGLAGVGFIEPILFGRIIDVLSNPGTGTPDENWSRTLELLGQIGRAHV